MRLSFLLLVVAAFLVASEAFSMAEDSNQVSKVGSPVGPSQRLLRAQYAEMEVGVGEKEMKKMMEMMQSKMTKEDFAKKLKIADQIDAIINKHALGMHEFMQTAKYKKYVNYMNFLNDMAKTAEYSALVREIKAKSQAQVARATFRKNPQTTQGKWQNIFNKLVKVKRIGK